MKIYAIRDRLIDYYMQPFVGPDDKPVLASVAKLVNTGDPQSDIAQAPHHFEVWKLGEVTEDGHLVPDRELVADCSSLVRPGIRPLRAGLPHGATPAEGGSQSPPNDLGRHADAKTGSVQAPPPAAPRAPQAAPEAAR